MKFTFIFILAAFSGCSADESKLSVGGLEEFKVDFISALPIGTEQRDVASYLDANKISYTYVDEEKRFYASIKKIGLYRLIYVTSLFIRIELDDNERLISIEFKLQHDGL